MAIYIRTRGSSIDYNFLLTKHPRLPNLNEYRSDFEQPTCILERTKEGKLYLFLSGIPSKRQAHQGTSLRYDLVVEMESGNYGDDSDNDKLAKHINGLIGLIWMWLNDVRKALQETPEDGKRVRLPAVTESQLGQRLDDTLTEGEEDVEELLKLTVERNWTPDQKNNLNGKLFDLILKIPTAEQGQEPDNKYWWGGIGDDDSCNQWIKLVEKLLKGDTQGKALLLNIATPKSLGRLSVGENEQLGVLLAKESYGAKPKQIEPLDLPKPDGSAKLSSYSHPLIPIFNQMLKNIQEKKKD